MKVIALALFVSFLTGCSAQSSRPSWSAKEKKNAQHFLTSLKIVSRAHAENNRRGFGIRSESEMNKMRSLYRQALNEAQQVDDAVLDKACATLRIPYRDLFQRGVEMRLGAWETADASASIESSKLLDKWADWYVVHGREIKIRK